MKTKTKQLWEVSILPNNQPPILLGEYYAASAKTAMELAAIDNEIPVDDCFCAEPAGEDTLCKRWKRH